MSIQTLADVSNNIFSIENPIPSEINNIFNPAGGVTFLLAPQYKINELLKKMFDNSNYSHLALYTAYQFYINGTVDIAKKKGIIDYLYGPDMYNIQNINTVNTKYLYSIFEILTRDSIRVNTILQNQGDDVSSIEKEIFQSSKKVYYETFSLDISNNILLSHFHNLSTSDVNSYWTAYLSKINKNLNLDSIDLSNKDLTNHTFTGYIMTNANLSNTNLTNADLSGANISNCNVENLNLTGANITNIVAHNLIGTPIGIADGFSYSPDRNTITKNKVEKTLEQIKTVVNDLGITNSEIETIDADTDIFNDGIVSINTQLNISNAITGTAVEKIKKRHGLLNYLFKKNTSVFNLKMSKDTISLPDRFDKSFALVFKPGQSINLSTNEDLGSDTGFYCPLDDGDFLEITNSDETIVFSVNRIGTIGDSGQYTVSKNSGTADLTLSLITSSTYNQNGYFMDNDTATVNGVGVFFGGVGETTSGSESTADPYVFSYYGKPTKLPDCKAIYKMLEGNNIHINSSVDETSIKQKEELYNWVNNIYNIDSDKLGLIADGYYYKKHWIYSEGNQLLCDMENNKMLFTKKSRKYFTITKSVDKDKTKELFGEIYLSYNISWKHSKYGTIHLTIRKYVNPQIDNGIGLVMEKNIKECGGLLIRNYKPSKLSINNIKHVKPICKNLVAGESNIRPLKGNTEVWTSK